MRHVPVGRLYPAVAMNVPPPGHGAATPPARIVNTSCNEPYRLVSLHVQSRGPHDQPEEYSAADGPSTSPLSFVICRKLLGVALLEDEDSLPAPSTALTT